MKDLLTQDQSLSIALVSAQEILQQKEPLFVKCIRISNWIGTCCNKKILQLQIPCHFFGDFTLLFTVHSFFFPSSVRIEGESK